MKKLILLLAGVALLVPSAGAQMSLVKKLNKEVSGAKSVEQFEAIYDAIQPALTNPESAGDVLTWLTAGKAQMGIYDKLSAMVLEAKVKGTDANVDVEKMNNALFLGYDLYKKALPLDSVVETEKDGTPKLDKNGQPKVKTKYSAEILQVLVSKIGAFAEAGNTYIGLADNLEGDARTEACKKATTAFDNYLKLVVSPEAAKQGVQVPQDALAEVSFFKGYAAYNGQLFQEAAAAFSDALGFGYTDNQVSDYYVSAVANTIQNLFDNKDYDKANEFIDNAIAEHAGNPILYDIKGSVIENEKSAEEAIEWFKKSTEVNPEYANGYLNIGRCLIIKGEKINNDNPDMEGKKLAALMLPVYTEAVENLTKAVQFDSSNTQAAGLLDDAKYVIEQLNNYK